MIGRALLVWAAILAFAILNGVVRDVVLALYMRDKPARAISSIVLAGVVVGITVLSLRWIGPSTLLQAVGIGAFWLALTLAFEFLFGHYLGGKPWPLLLAEYDVLRGRLWVVVLIATVLAPPSVYRAMHQG